VKVSYLTRHWPDVWWEDQLPDEDPMRFGWMIQDDWFNGRLSLRRPSTSSRFRRPWVGPPVPLLPVPLLPLAACPV
jgi:hypothetical protein